MKFNYTTIEQLGQRIRERFRDATGEEACKIASWLLNRTDAQLRTLFGITQTQVNQLRTRLTTKRDAYLNMISQTGE